VSAALQSRLHPDIERVALLGWRCVPATRSKKGFWVGYIDAATTDLDQLDRWSFAYPRCNWKVIPSGSGVWALDVDVPSRDHKDDGVAVLKLLVERHGAIPERPHGRSGSGGHLMVFQDAGHPINSKSGHPEPGLDPKGGRNAFTISPSRNDLGSYRWAAAPWELAPPIAPDWLLKLVAPPPQPPRPPRPTIISTSRAQSLLEREVNRVLNAGPGKRNSTLNEASFTVGGLIGGGLLDEREAICALYDAARYIRLDDHESRATIKSGIEGGMKMPIKGAGHG